MNIFALAHGPPGTGTHTSTSRIATHLRGAGHQVQTVIHADQDQPSVEALMAATRADAVVATHAYYGGRFLVQVQRPGILVLSGTDLNLLSASPGHLAVMSEAVAHARRVVTYNADFRQRALKLWPELEHKIRCIPKGVATYCSRFRLRAALGLPSDARIFLLPAGLREVKDVLYLADSFDTWHSADARVHLAIVGVPWEAGYAELIYRRCAESPALFCLDPMPQADLHAAMREATAVLNTSRSECCPNAVLEAMHLGALVMVRDIPGNTCLVDHEVSGMVFNSPAKFRAAARDVLARLDRGRAMAAEGQRRVQSLHTLQSEQQAYADLIASLGSAC